ncbi:short chain dehydrogenase [Purpureocillium lilacinum]|uniref:Short chain dehydrogenase n=1 Tax=Purpureocillium lilacinum TaxID=33203 RepID=A0A179FP96_PURLI|nr:short chain dehydrogenase [Purpureocillium lilacinum]
MSLLGKTALVTGAAGGLGLAIARALHPAGANVMVCDINPERLAQAEHKFLRSPTPLTPGTSPSQPRSSPPPSSSVSPPEVRFYPVDVTVESDVKALIEATISAFGALHVVVNNAAIMDRFDPAGACAGEVWNRVMSVNATGPFLVTKHALPWLLKRRPRVVEGDGTGADPMMVDDGAERQEDGDGRAGDGAAVGKEDDTGRLIVNIASNASFRGLSAGVAYTASKHALLGLTRNTAGFYGPKGVSCVALALGGLTDTNISDAFALQVGDEGTEDEPKSRHWGVNREGVAKMMETQPGNRLAKIEDVAQTVVFLAEGGGRGMNGSCVTINDNWPEA